MCLGLGFSVVYIYISIYIYISEQSASIKNSDGFLCEENDDSPQVLRDPNDLKGQAFGLWS